MASTRSADLAHGLHPVCDCFCTLRSCRGICSFPKQKKGVPGLDEELNPIPLEVISPRSVAAAMA
eukprot:COSAG01_NODE_5067_length_4516_cov_456.515961_6_plen_65_part_00